MGGVDTKMGGGNGWFGNTFMNEGGGFNMDSIGSIASTIGDFGKLYMGYQANKLAKETLNFQKNSYNTNLTNQISSYNTALEDRARGRTSTPNSAETEAYIKKHSL